LISALQDKEITGNEFSDSLGSLPSEVLQITGTIIALSGVNEPLEPQLAGVHPLCRKLAAMTRVLS
jgi:hypothetical protein